MPYVVEQSEALSEVIFELMRKFIWLSLLSR